MVCAVVENETHKYPHRSSSVLCVRSSLLRGEIFLILCCRSHNWAAMKSPFRPDGTNTAADSYPIHMHAHHCQLYNRQQPSFCPICCCCLVSEEKNEIFPYFQLTHCSQLDASSVCICLAFAFHFSFPLRLSLLPERVVRVKSFVLSRGFICFMLIEKKAISMKIMYSLNSFASFRLLSSAVFFLHSAYFQWNRILACSPCWMWWKREHGKKRRNEEESEDSEWNENV